MVPGDSLVGSDTSIPAGMDPRLQRLVEMRQRGQTLEATASTDAGEIAVIARVSSLDDWVNLSEVRAGGTIGRDESGDAHIVTARIPLQRVEAVRAQPFVRSLKPAEPVRPALAATIEETAARADLLPPAAEGGQGEGVVVGIVDFGCDFAHENFRREDGSTRLLAIWDQTAAARPGSPFGYGRLHDSAAIDAALAAADPFAALGYGPEIDPTGSHGTHVMDIAAGGGRGSGVPGVAPNADLVFVELASSDIPWAGERVVGRSFGDSVQLLEAVRFIFDLAGERPCVVNLSLGTNGGPHDGTTLVEQGLDAMARERPGRAVVIAASNSYADGIHGAGAVAAGGSVDVEWQVPAGDRTQNEMEVWYSGADTLEPEIVLPDGTSLGRIAAGTNRRWTSGGVTAIFAAHRAGDPNNGDNTIGIFMERGLPSGTWRIRLHGVNTGAGGGFHAWIERDDAGPSEITAPRDDAFTLGSISCGRESVVVGSYDAHRTALPLSWFSSSGPTRDGREKPELSAPGHNVVAALSRSRDGVTRMSGTSMAAPAVAGVIALMLAEARALGRPLSSGEIRDILGTTARRNPPAASGWDRRYGAGRVDARACVAEVRSRLA